MKEGQPQQAFHQGQRIVYPAQGVGLVEAISKRPLNGKETLYYTIYIEANDMTVMVPTSRAEELGLRTIVAAEEAQQALTVVGLPHSPMTTDWKQRYQINYDLLKKGGVEDIALVVRNLYHRSKVKELPIMERKVYDNALRLLIDEVSFAINKDKEEVEKLLLAKLESTSKAQAAKPSPPAKEPENTATEGEGDS